MGGRQGFKGEKTIFLDTVDDFSTDETIVLNSNYSPYLFKSTNFQFHNYKNVTIEAGVTIYVDEGITIYNNKDVIINGTSNSHITITSSNATPAAGDWNGFYIVNGDYAASISYLDIEYYNLLDITGSGTFTISDSTFSNFESYGMRVFRTAPINILYSTIDGNNGASIGISFQQHGVVVTNVVGYSVIRNCQYDGISLSYKSSAEITYSNFINNSSNNISGDSSYDLTLTNNYWDYAGGDVDNSNYRDKLKIDTDFSGDITWSPYSTSQIAGTGPR